MHDLASSQGSTSPLVSIIMPAYNASAYIGAAITSAQQQTVQDFEILVADDASTDDTAAIVAAMAQADARIRLIRLPQNGGPGAARNAAMAAATGTWIALLDADDRFAPTRLQHLLALANCREADMVSDNVALCAEQDGEPYAAMFSKARVAGEMQLTAATFIEENTDQPAGQRTAFGFMQPMFRRGFLQAHGLRYNDESRFGEDFMFYVRCLLAGARWWVTPEPLYLYRICPGSLSDTVSYQDLETISAMEQAILEDSAHAADEGLLQTVRKHRRGVDHWRYTTEYRTRMQRRQIGHALRVMFQSGLSLHAIMRDIVARSVVRETLSGLRLFRMNAPSSRSPLS